MPETAESLGFDQDGICSVCRQIEYKQVAIDWAERGRALDKLIAAHRGKSDYDCLVPFSGGKDTTFTLWYLTAIKKLKVLAVRFDHGFFRTQVNENAKQAFSKLGVDVVQFTPQWPVVRKLMYESLKRRGDFCWHCHTGIFAYPMWAALEKRVPLLFWGEPDAEYSSFYGYDEEVEHDERRFNRMINLGINAEDMLGMLDNTISDHPVTVRDLKPFTFPPVAELRKLGVRSVFLGHYIPWDVKKQVEVIKRELDWREDEVEGIPPEYGYEKIECYMQGVRDYIKFLKRGFGRTAHLASIDIRNGRLSRDAGMALIEKHDGRRPAALDVFLEALGIDEKQFTDLVAPHVVAPNKMPCLGECPSCNSVPRDFNQWKPGVASKA